MGERADERAVPAADGEGDHGREDRRRFLWKAGAAGAAAWVAPVILSTPASAATTDQTSPTEPPPCISCNSVNVTNPSFEDQLAGWSVNLGVMLQTYANLFPTIPAPPPGAGAVMAVVADPHLIDPANPSEIGRLEQRLDIDQQCVGRPYTLTFWSGETGFHPGQAPVYGLQFSDVQGDLGAPNTLAPPEPAPGTVNLGFHTLSGTVRGGATSVTIFFTSGESVVDLVDFTICA
jgi:hypothetical protein